MSYDNEKAQRSNASYCDRRGFHDLQFSHEREEPEDVNAEYVTYRKVNIYQCTICGFTTTG